MPRRSWRARRVPKGGVDSNPLGRAQMAWFFWIIVALVILALLGYFSRGRFTR
jgi:hypothetical protein